MLQLLCLPAPCLFVRHIRQASSPSLLLFYSLLPPQLLTCVSLTHHKAWDYVQVLFVAFPLLPFPLLVDLAYHHPLFNSSILWLISPDNLSTNLPSALTQSASLSC